jgi:sterol desaturase/sphingolipid hydroxylase (fatty acid hydroxylase superfamily)
MDILDFIKEVLDVTIQNVLSVKKRTHYYYLISSLLLAYYIYKQQKRKASFLNYVLNKKIWFGNSAKVDYLFILFNSFVKILLIFPFLIYGLKFSFHTNSILVSNLGINEYSLSTSETLVYYTIAITVFGDFFTYLVHLLFHKIPFLWEFHKTHHSATTLSPLTLHRIHPIELIANNMVSMFTFGLITGLFDYLSNNQISLWSFVGVNVFTFIFNVYGANLRHSHVKLKYFNFLEYFIISPMQHQVHHSDNPEHYDKNLGSKFAVWDWLFGTLIKSNEVHKITYGLGNNDNKNYSSFTSNFLNPFKSIFKR